jgi:two-component system nitrate/nitrite response regulator NarL
MIRVSIVGDVHMYREGLARILSKQPGIEVIGAFACSDNVHHSLLKLNPDVVLIDTPISSCGCFVKQVLDVDSSIKIIAFALPEKDENVIACAEAGYSGFVSREASVNDLVDAIHAAYQGELICPPKIAGSLLRRVAFLSAERKPLQVESRVTNREMQVAKLIHFGLSNKEIAKKLCIEVSTVKNHVHNLLEKLDVRRRYEAAARLSHLFDHHSAL